MKPTPMKLSKSCKNPLLGGEEGCRETRLGQGLLWGRVGTGWGAGSVWEAGLEEVAGRDVATGAFHGLSCRGHPLLTHSLPRLTRSWLGVATITHIGAFKEKTHFELLQDYRKVSRCLFKQVCLNRKIKQTGSYFSFSTYTIFEMISKDIFSHNWTMSGYRPFDQIGALYVVSHQRASKLQIKAGFRFCLWSSQINWILFPKVIKGVGENTKIKAG